MINSANKGSTKRINQEARHWFIRMNTETVDDNQRRLFDEWVSARPDHRKAYKEVEFLWESMGKLAVDIESEFQQKDAQPIPPKSPSRDQSDFASRLARNFFRFFAIHPLSSALSAALIVTMAIFLLLPDSPTTVNERIYISKVGEIRQIDLADGSQIALGAESKMRTRIRKGIRWIDLIQGEAYFSVKKDPSSPFQVTADDLSITVVGTQFDVRKRVSGIFVAVAEGIVDITQRSAANNLPAATSSVVLTAGQQVIKPNNQPLQAVEKIAEVELGAWRNGWLIYHNSNLADVLADANRYFDGTISLENSELADEKVTVTLRTDQIVLLPDMLAQTLPIIVSKQPGNKFILNARPALN